MSGKLSPGLGRVPIREGFEVIIQAQRNFSRLAAEAFPLVAREILLDSWIILSPMLYHQVALPDPID